MTQTDDRLESLARVICAADGHDPDALILPDPRLARGPKGRFYMPTVEYSQPIPAWRLFIREATAAADWFDARVAVAKQFTPDEMLRYNQYEANS